MTSWTDAGWRASPIVAIITTTLRPLCRPPLQWSDEPYECVFSQCLVTVTGLFSTGRLLSAGLAQCCSWPVLFLPVQELLVRIGCMVDKENPQSRPPSPDRGHALTRIKTRQTLELAAD